MRDDEIQPAMRSLALTAMICLQLDADLLDDEQFFRSADSWVESIRQKWMAVPESHRTEAVMHSVRELLLADAWMYRALSETQQASRPTRYAAFLYGINIPNGTFLSTAEIARRMERLPRGFGFHGTVATSGNLILSSSRSEVQLRSLLALRFPGIRYVIVNSEELRGAIETSKRRLSELGYRDVSPYRRQDQNDDEWELGIVLCFEPLPENLNGPAGLFEPTRNAVAREVLNNRSLLVEKRGGRPRITWGDSVNGPWRRLLERHQINQWCFTSRSMGTLEKVLRRFDDLGEIT